MTATTAMTSPATSGIVQPKAAAAGVLPKPCPLLTVSSSASSASAAAPPATPAAIMRMRMPLLTSHPTRGDVLQRRNARYVPPLETETLHPRLQCLCGEPKHLCRFGDVRSGPIERLADEVELDLFEIHAVLGQSEP